MRILRCALVLLAAALASPARAGSVDYAPTSANFANPERGFYHFTGDCDSAPFSAATLRNYRTNEGISLVMCVFYLSDFKTSPISPAALAFFQRQMDTVRSAGVKAVVRFAYTQSTSGDDATRAQVEAHLDQLAPYLQLILRRASGPGTYRFSLAVDPRGWLPGTTHTIHGSVALPADMPVDSYALLLALPDAAPTLAGRPEYSIQLANAGVWEASTGLNDLGHTMMVLP